MATIDLSRHATDFRKHYHGLRAQQGRVATDDDFNEAARLAAENERRETVDVIGPAGSPDAGFQLKIFPTDRETKKQALGLAAGTFYVGGLRLDLERDEPFARQSDWLQQATAVDGVLKPQEAGGRHDLIWLDVWQQPVSAIEDKELFEAALGGPDTSVRIRTMRRAHVLPDVPGPDCAAACAKLREYLRPRGTWRLQEDFRLETDATLKVEPDGSQGSGDLCTPPVQGGYLGAENQAIRVQLVDDTHFTWGFDNAAPLYRVQLESSTKRVIMVDQPKDQAHYPLAGQVVELLPWGAVLSNSQKVAESSGSLAKVTGGYNSQNLDFTIDQLPPAAYGAPYFYLRVWNRGADMSSDAKIPFQAGQPITLGTTGLRITISGTQFAPNDFWIIAVRPATPNQFVPWELGVGRPPQGVRRWVAPLGIIRWDTGKPVPTVVSDCRPRFRPLTRQMTCCTYRVGNGKTSFGDFNNIQQAIDHLPHDEGGRVCVLAGEHKGPVRIVDRSDIILSGCGPDTVIRGDGSGSSGPVIYVARGRDITVESLAVAAEPEGAGIVIEGQNSYVPGAQDVKGWVKGVVVAEVEVTGGSKAALSARFVQDLTIRDSVFRNADEANSEHAVVVLGDDVLIKNNLIEIGAKESGGTGGVAAPAQFSRGVNAEGGLHLEGTCERVRVLDNLIRGGVGHGITLGTITQLADGDPPGQAAGEGVTTLDPWASINDGGSGMAVEVQTTGQTQTGSLGALWDIVIERNRIEEMGWCGIAVMGFFDLSKADEFVSVNGLSLRGNRIRGNLWRPLAEINPAMVDSMGYGGISLADVSNLVIRDNEMANNGLSAVEPVCGIFVLHAEGLEISGNHITDGGRSSGSTGSSSTTKVGLGAAGAGRRGGINIAYALPVVIPADDRISVDPLQLSGLPAARIHDNVVAVSLGQSLSLCGVGPMSILGNQLATRGVVETGTSATWLAANVAILNLGLSNELYLQLLAFASIAQGNVDAFGVHSQPGPGLDDAGVGRLLADGNVLFSDNQCVLDLLESSASWAVSSIGIASLDDIHFHGNQCDCDLLFDLILTHALLVGFSVRMTDNRFKEGYFNAMFSAVALGWMASAVGNQSTHCLLVNGSSPYFTVDNSNPSLFGWYGPWPPERSPVEPGHHCDPPKAPLRSLLVSRA